ncbi:unnamed protein product [Pleuronectes platessa]|uniref:Uncharacterized protein n=1 Tax=Pleuronectes platessa TaxID=8262 RepID=A0A9N7VXM9_PLEPL|nr:unnamed protein product [Pleuronectes platessa]
MFASVSFLENTGACPSCGNPICRPKVMAPPFPPHPPPFTVTWDRRQNVMCRLPPRTKRQCIGHTLDSTKDEKHDEAWTRKDHAAKPDKDASKLSARSLTQTCHVVWSRTPFYLSSRTVGARATGNPTTTTATTTPSSLPSHSAPSPPHHLLCTASPPAPPDTGSSPQTLNSDS